METQLSLQISDYSNSVKQLSIKKCYTKMGTSDKNPHNMQVGENNIKL